jgi:aryl-alcohol dehydrogenase-like predicted oxidoreductase
MPDISTHPENALVERAPIHKIEALRAVGNEAGMRMATMATAWVLANPAVTAPIIGASRPERLAESLAAAEAALSSDLKGLDEIAHRWRAVDAGR